VNNTRSGERAQESIKKVGVSSSDKNKPATLQEREKLMSWEILDISMSKEEEKKKFSSKPKLCLKKGGKMILNLKLKRRMLRFDF
jgi:hypothetical protein